MYSYRFLIGVALAVVLVGAISSIDLALAGAQPARTPAQADAQPVARMIGLEPIDGGLDSANGQLQFGGGGFNFQGGGFQGGGFNFQGGGFNFGGGGGFQGGGLNFQGGGGFQGGLQGGFNFGGNFNSPLAGSGDGRAIGVTGHLNCATPGEVVDIQMILSQSATGAVAVGETQVLCTGVQPTWLGVAVAVGPTSFLPGNAQACARAIGPVTRAQWCRAGGVTLVPNPVPPPIVPPPPPPY
jgi:hypothetical protein